MRFRFRLGPFTFGRSGTRLSLWRGGSGLSIPSLGKGRSFGKIGIGPFSWFFGGTSANPDAARSAAGELEKEQGALSSYEDAAFEALRADGELLNRLRRYGVPWRGVQERLKEELPDHLPDRNTIAYGLVPRAMDAVVGRQGIAWKTEKRPSKKGDGHTTWIVRINIGA
jgi:hypothetical protein